MQGMREVLRQSLARSLRSWPGEDRLAAALAVVCGAVVCGSAMAAHCEVARLDEDGRLHLCVFEREWLQPLLGMREILQRELARIAGVPLNGLHFEVAGAAGRRRPDDR